MQPALAPRPRRVLRDAAQAGGRGRDRCVAVGLLARRAVFRSGSRRPICSARITRTHRPAAHASTRIGRANLTAAFPEKSPDEIETHSRPASGTISAASAPNSRISITSGSTISHIPKTAAIEIDARTHELFAQLRHDGKPALIFASHLGNWELPALAAVAHGLDAAVLFRRPNIASADRAIHENPRGQYGHDDPGAAIDAPFRLGAGAAERPARRHAGRSVFAPTASTSHSSAARPRPIRCWRGCCGRSNARSTACGSIRLPRPPLPRRDFGRSSAGARRRRTDRHSGHDAGRSHP